MSEHASRNITLHLPVDLIRQAKVYAAQHDTTVTALVKDLLEKTVTAESESRARAAGKRFLELAREGTNSTVDPGAFPRDEIYRDFDV